MFPPLPFRWLAPAAVVCLAGCTRNSDGAAWWQGERERIELQHEITLKTLLHDTGAARDFEQLQTLQATATALAADLADSRSRRDAIAAEVTGLEDGQAEFKRQVVETRRQQALETEFSLLKLPGGRTYREVAVTGIDDAGVQVRHADGTARLGPEDLSEERARFFGLDPELVHQARTVEKQQALVYERTVAAHLATVRQEKQREAALAENAAAARRREREQLIARQMKLAAERPLARPPENVRSSRRSYYRTYRTRYYYPTYVYPAPASGYGSKFRRAEPYQAIREVGPRITCP